LKALKNNLKVAAITVKAAPDCVPMLEIDVDIPHKQEGCRHQKFSASARVDADIPHVSVGCRHQFIGTGIQSGSALNCDVAQSSSFNFIFE
jgi:hypothetical protein